MLNQDLHIHTIFSTGDSAVVEQQTPELIAEIHHAEITGISDHFEHITEKRFYEYRDRIKGLGLLLGTEVNGAEWVDEAGGLPFDYYIMHCFDTTENYRAVERLLKTERPVIIAHPMMLGTNLDRVPTECFVEINNRYVWRFNWRSFLPRYKNRFRFVLSSDAHQPNWLNQTVATHVAKTMGVKETVVLCDLDSPEKAYVLIDK